MKKNLNGSVETLAKAMRQVFKEATEGALEPVAERLDGIDGRLDGIEENMATKEDLDGVQEGLDKLSSRVAHHQKALDGIKNRMPKPKRT